MAAKKNVLNRSVDLSTIFGMQNVTGNHKKTPLKMLPEFKLNSLLLSYKQIFITAILNFTSSPCNY